MVHNNSERRRRSIRNTPRLEGLEDRRLLVSFNPLASAADGSPSSLRYAIQLADANDTDNTITLQRGVYQLAVANLGTQENSAATGDLDLNGIGHTITIQGAGAGATIIDGGKLDRVFQILPGVRAIFRNLTIQNGVAQDDGSNGAVPGTSYSAGGGILNQGMAELDGVVVQDCSAAGSDGTGGMPGAGTEAGVAGQEAFGGGIFNAIGATLVLNGCLVSGNTAVGGKGGDGLSGGDPTAFGASGGGGIGGGIVNVGTLTVSQSAIVGNAADGGAGGAGGSVLFGGGLAAGFGGAALGGGLYVSPLAAQTRIIDSTIAANLALGGAGGAGGPGSSDGAVGLDGGQGGDSRNAEGGGIAADTAIGLYNSTIAANQAMVGNPGPGGAGGLGFRTSGNPGGRGDSGNALGGGIWAPTDVPGAPGRLTSISAIIAYNATTTTLDQDIDGTFANATNTLLGVGAGGTGIANGVNGNLVGVDPMLGPLQNNGGPTPTLAVLSGSPAKGAGSNPLGLTADQRGYTPRGSAGATDIGAFQSGASAPSGGGGKITVKIVNVKGHRQIRVYNAATGALKFEVYPFGTSYRGTFQVQERDVNGDHVPDVIAQYRVGRKKLVTRIFSGVDGSVLPNNLA